MSEPYSTRLSKAAIASRGQLPHHLVSALWQVCDEIAQDPDAHPELTEPLTTQGNLILYKHPSPPLEITYEIDRTKNVLNFVHFVAPAVQVKKQVFISYCHDDAEWLNKLRMFLRPLEARGLINVWDDSEIKPGSKWLEEIEGALDHSNVAVLLVTQRFIDSPFIKNKELPHILDKAEKKGCQIFWIAVGSSTVDDTEIKKYEAANNPDEPLNTLPPPQQDKVLKEIYDRMKKVVTDHG